MAIRGAIGDPRVAATAAGEASVRPVVALPRAGVPAWAIGVGAVAAGLLLFAVLDARRRAPSSPAVRMRASDLAGVPVPPPALYVPPAIPEPVQTIAPAPPPAPLPAPPPAPRIVYVPQPIPVPPPPPPPPPPMRVANDPVLVVDTSVAQAGAAAAAAEGEAGASAGAAGTAVPGARTRAGMLANRATTVQQGTLIQAVLETALDSTRPGFARAIVSRDVRGFDGTRILIPRGSRLIGEYRSEAAPGQRRALVNWIRLVRPDGVTVAIGSPAADPLGRGGIGAHVNSHFFARFAGAILQSALDIGVNLASARTGAGTVLVFPGAVQGATTQIVQPSQVTPTLTVRQGTSISIFVARDLDFTGVENRR